MNSIISCISELKEYRCHICYGFMNNPFQLTPCGHVFCMDCISKIETRYNKKICPLCRAQCDPFFDGRLQREICNKIVSCDKCETKVVFSEMQNHLTRQCEKI